MSEDEQALVAAAVAGDEDALSRLLVLNHDRLTGAISVRIPAEIRGLIAADDVAQEAFVVVFRRIAEFVPVPGATFFDWLLGIAENVLRDAVRRQRADKRGGGRARVAAGGDNDDELVGLLELLVAHSRTPSRSAAQSEAAAAVQAALASVAEDYREALRMRYLEAMPVAEIAQRMQRSEGAIHQLCHRGLRALRDSLGESVRFLSRKE